EVPLPSPGRWAFALLPVLPEQGRTWQNERTVYLDCERRKLAARAACRSKRPTRRRESHGRDHRLLQLQDRGSAFSREPLGANQRTRPDGKTPPRWRRGPAV